MAKDETAGPLRATQAKHNGAPAQTRQSGPRGEGSRGELNGPSGEAGGERYEACGGEGYTPASFEKRTAAWMGIVYVLMLIFILNFTLFTGGKQLPGTFPLFLVPVSGALAVILIRRLKLRTCPGGTAGGALGLIACAAGMFLGLALGVPALLAALEG